MAHLEFFSQPLLALNNEVSHHPDLCLLVSKHPPQELELRIAEIAAYCGVILDGLYDAVDIDNIADILVRTLVAKRTLILV